jgi:hypothetical protein
LIHASWLSINTWKNNFQSDSGHTSSNLEAEDTAEVVAEAAAQHLPDSEAASQMNVAMKEAAKVSGGTRASEDSEEEKVEK